MKNWSLIALGSVMLAAASPLAAATGDMTVATFLAKYEALLKKGLFALGSADVGLLKAEGEAAGQAYLARLNADKAAGRTPHSCPPKGYRLGQSEFIRGTKQYPVAARNQTTLKMVVADLMRRKFPCQG